MLQLLHVIAHSWIMFGLQIFQRRLQCKRLVFQIERLLSKGRERRRLRTILFICAFPSQWCCQMAVCLHALHKELDVILSIQHPPATIGAFHANGDGQVGIQYCGVHGFFIILRRE